VLIKNFNMTLRMTMSALFRVPRNTVFRMFDKTEVPDQRTLSSPRSGNTLCIAPHCSEYDLDQGSATYGPRAGFGPPSKIIRPAAPLQSVVTLWPT